MYLEFMREAESLDVAIKITIKDIQAANCLVIGTCIKNDHTVAYQIVKNKGVYIY